MIQWKQRYEDIHWRSDHFSWAEIVWTSRKFDNAVCATVLVITSENGQETMIVFGDSSSAAMTDAPFMRSPAEQFEWNRHRTLSQSKLAIRHGKAITFYNRNVLVKPSTVLQQP